MKNLILTFVLVILSTSIKASNGIAQESTPQQKEYIRTLAKNGSDKEIMNFQSRMIIIDLKHEDTDGKFYPSSFTYKIQKSIPNHMDRLNADKVRKFMLTFEINK